jgi:hypothetical protein
VLDVVLDDLFVQVGAGSSGYHLALEVTAGLGGRQLADLAAVERRVAGRGAH